MNGKRVRMVADLAAPHLGQGEQIEMTVYANVGSVSVKRAAVTAAAVAVATAGTFTAFVRPRKTYLAITGQRLMFFNGETVSGRPGNLLFSLPRQAVSVARVNNGLLTLKADLAVEGQEKGLRLVFPAAGRKDGRQAIAALEATASVS